MTALSKEQILSADNYRREQVEMPEWGGHVFVTAVSAADWMDFQDEAAKDRDTEKGFSTAPWVGRMLVRTIVDGNGARIFGDDDGPGLMRLPLKVINRLYRAADKLNDFTGRGVKEAEKTPKRGLAKVRLLPRS